MIVHTQADHLLPQLLVQQFDTLPIQRRHIEHMHGGVWFKNNSFWQNDGYESLDNFPSYGFCICVDSAFMGWSTPTTALDKAIWYFAYTM